MSGGDDRAVVLPVEGGRAEVDELDPGVAHAPDVALGGGAVLAVPVRAHEQDVLRLQVGVGQVVVVQKLKKISRVENIIDIYGLFCLSTSQKIDCLTFLKFRWAKT